MIWPQIIQFHSRVSASQLSDLSVDLILNRWLRLDMICQLFFPHDSPRSLVLLVTTFYSMKQTLKLCRKFILNLIKHPRHSRWMGWKKNVFCVVQANNHRSGRECLKLSRIKSSDRADGWHFERFISSIVIVKCRRVGDFQFLLFVDGDGEKKEREKRKTRNDSRKSQENLSSVISLFCFISYHVNILRYGVVFGPRPGNDYVRGTNSLT